MKKVIKLKLLVEAKAASEQEKLSEMSSQATNFARREMKAREISTDDKPLIENLKKVVVSVFMQSFGIYFTPYMLNTPPTDTIKSRLFSIIPKPLKNNIVHFLIHQAFEHYLEPIAKKFNKSVREEILNNVNSYVEQIKKLRKESENEWEEVEQEIESIMVEAHNSLDIEMDFDQFARLINGKVFDAAYLRRFLNIQKFDNYSISEIGHNFTQLLRIIQEDEKLLFSVLNEFASIPYNTIDYFDKLGDLIDTKSTFKNPNLTNKLQFNTTNEKEGVIVVRTKKGIGHWINASLSSEDNQIWCQLLDHCGRDDRTFNTDFYYLFVGRSPRPILTISYEPKNNMISQVVGKNNTKLTHPKNISYLEFFDKFLEHFGIDYLDEATLRHHI